MPEPRQRFVVEFTADYSEMVTALRERLDVSQIEVFRQAIARLYQETFGEEAE